MKKRRMIFGVLAVLVGVLVGLAIPAWAEEQVISDVPAGNYGDLKLTHRNSMEKVEKQIRETGLTPYSTKERMLVETQSLSGKWYTGWIPAGTLLLCEVSQDQDGATIYMPKTIAICGNAVKGIKIRIAPPVQVSQSPPQPQQPPKKKKKIVVVEQPQQEEDEEVIVVQQPPPRKRVIYVYIQAPADYSENYSRQMYSDDSGYNSGYGSYGFGILLPPPPPIFGGRYSYDGYGYGGYGYGRGGYGRGYGSRVTCPTNRSNSRPAAR